MSNEENELLKLYESQYTGRLFEKANSYLLERNALFDEREKLYNLLVKIKEKGVMYYDPEYSKIYGELCSMPGANNTRTPVIVIDDDILELLEEIK